MVRPRDFYRQLVPTFVHFNPLFSETSAMYCATTAIRSDSILMALRCVVKLDTARHQLGHTIWLAPLTGALAVALHIPSRHAIHGNPLRLARLDTVFELHKLALAAIVPARACCALGQRRLVHPKREVLAAR